MLPKRREREQSLKQDTNQSSSCFDESKLFLKMRLKSQRRRVQLVRTGTKIKTEIQSNLLTHRGLATSITRCGFHEHLSPRTLFHLAAEAQVELPAARYKPVSA